MSPLLRRLRLLPLVLGLVLALVLSGCSGDGDGDEPKDGTSGLLKASDLPFEARYDDSLARPPILTQLATRCLGIEQGALYDADWKVKAKQFYDRVDWTVVSAAFTAPSSDADAEKGLDLVRERMAACDEEGAAVVKELSVGEGTYAYEVQEKSGAFNAARAYKPLDDGTLAQVSLMKLPDDQDPEKVLQDLVGKLG